MPSEPIAKFVQYAAVAIAIAFLGAIAGSYLGAWLTTHIPADNLKRAFGAF